ncbi:MAG: hypothetical protein ABSD03_09350 [Vulcanimicrobiaceae bacterium]
MSVGRVEIAVSPWTSDGVATTCAIVTASRGSAAANEAVALPLYGLGTSGSPVRDALQHAADEATRKLLEIEAARGEVYDVENTVVKSTRTHITINVAGSVVGTSAREVAQHFAAMIAPHLKELRDSTQPAAPS